MRLKRNRLTERQTGLLSSQIPQKTEIQTVDTFSSPGRFPTLGILHTSLLLTLSLPLFRGGHCWDQAEHTASSCTWSRTKSGGSPHSQLDSEGLSRKARTTTSPTYKRIFLARNESRSRNVSSHTRQAITSATPMALSTSHLMFGKKKLSSVSPEGSIPEKRREKGLRTAHTHWLPRSGWRFPKFRGLGLTQQRKSMSVRSHANSY